MSIARILGFALLAAGPALANDGAPPAVLTSSTARFVFGQLGPVRADQYMLDTATGRLWQVVCVERDSAGQCKGVGLQVVPYLDAQGQPFTTPPPVIQKP